MRTIKAVRKTTESVMGIILDFSPLAPNYREKICTPIPFLNHMIEHIAYRAGFNIKTTTELTDFTLTHLITEDLGMALGKAVKEYIDTTDGAMGFGDAVGMIDEARASAAISFESRAYIDIDYHGNTIPAETEGMLSEDLETFLEGFVQGAMCTLHIDLYKGHNGHHIWEAICRALGSALNRATAVSEERKGKTSGVAGKIEWTIEG
ncbi:MAG: hypothetical protein IJC09_04315 [Clostridia bacterium]|nr:hypothetical protein [Clostridia bacterium]